MLGLQPYIAPYINSRLFLIPTILGMAAALCLALALMLRDRLVPAGVLSLGCGVALGVVAACVAQRPLPADHVLRRIATGTVGLSTPLRWHGTLRSEPAKLPWGYGIDVDLSGVDEAEQFILLSGGMRLKFAPKDGDMSLPEVGAGDQVAVIAQGRLPPIYRDEGAFDRKEFLAAVGARVGIIRAGELRMGHPSPVLLQRLEESRMRVLRTGRESAVRVLTDGRDLRVSCYVRAWSWAKCVVFCIDTEPQLERPMRSLVRGMVS